MASNEEEMQADPREKIVKLFAEMTSLDFVSSRQQLEEAQWRLNVALKRHEEKHYSLVDKPFEPKPDQSSDSSLASSSMTGNARQSRSSSSNSVKFDEDFKEQVVDRFSAQTGISKQLTRDCLESNMDKICRTIAHNQARGFGIGPSAEKDKKPKHVPFKGAGNRLGGEEDYAKMQAEKSAEPAAVASGLESKSEVEERDYVIADNFDSTQPSTTLQIQLRDNTKIKAQFNHTHTVGDVRRNIALWCSVPESYRLVSRVTFPARKLDDPSVSLLSADLLGATLHML